MANLTKKVIGVDVSSKILVMSFLNNEGKNTIMNVNNEKIAIVKCLKKISPDAYKIVMEATGSYSSKILYYAHSMGFKVYQFSGLSKYLTFAIFLLRVRKTFNFCF